MLFNFASISYAAKADLAAANIKLVHSHVLEGCAALCGYGTLAAFLSGGSASTLVNSEIVVLDAAYARARLVKLGASTADAEATAGILSVRMKQDALSSNLPSMPKIFTSFDNFHDDYLQEIIQYRVLDSSEMSSAIAETNASDFDVYIEDVSWDEEIRKARGAWIIQAEGTFAGEQDEDRVYHGHEGDFTIRIDFDKVDRVGLREADSEVAAAIVDRYAED